jgi:hypothetical protein
MLPNRKYKNGDFVFEKKRLYGHRETSEVACHKQSTGLFPVP